MILINKQIKSFFNKKILYILSFTIACTTSTSVKSNPLDYKIWVAAESHESFPNANYISNYGIRSAGFQAKKDINKNISSQIAINILSNNKIAIDDHADDDRERLHMVHHGYGHRNRLRPSLHGPHLCHSPRLHADVRSSAVALYL